MMAVEGPYLAAIIARLPEAKFNLAAYGVAFALAVLIEAPVIMLMSAGTSLAKDRRSFFRLRRFGWMLCLATTAVLLAILIPPVYSLLTHDLMGLPEEVAELTYGALWFFLPWPAAIGYRRLLQGLLIRARKTRLVAWGTAVRLATMSLTAFGGAILLDLPGASIGGLALSTAVVCEAVVVRIMAGPTLRDLMRGRRRKRGGSGTSMSYREIAAFYFPLMLTPVIAMAAQPMLTFFMGRSVSPLESLAVFPVVNSVAFFFRSVCMAYQDAAIALMGNRFRHYRQLRTFALVLGTTTTLGLALVAFTPVSDLWFVTISGLTPELEQFALAATRAVFPIPFFGALLSLQRAILVEGRSTGHVTKAGGVEVVGIAALFMVLGFEVGLVGATAAFAAILGGRVMANAYLLWPCRSSLKGAKAR